MNRPFSLVVSLALAAAACGNGPCAKEGRVEPGKGWGAPGGALCIGMRVEELATALGSAPERTDLGSLGVRFRHPELPDVLGYLSGQGSDATMQSIEIGAGPKARTRKGSAVGEPVSTVEEEFGAATLDPFLGTLWYPDLGIAFETEDGDVSRIHVFEPETDGG